MKKQFQNRNFMILITGQIISLFGSAVQRFALSLYLLDLTGSASIFAGILALSMVPIVIFAPIAGMIADRADKRKVMVGLDVISGLVIAGYILIVANGSDHYVVVAAVMMVLAAASTIYQATVTASLPELVSEEELLSANGLVYQVSSLANFLGPVIAGVLYGFFGIQAILIVNAISFIASAVLEWQLKMTHNRKPSGQSLLKLFKADMLESYTYLRHKNPIILRMIVTAGLFNLFMVPIFSVGSPYIIKITLGLSSQVYGVVEGLIALGMIAGAFIVSSRPHVFSITRVHHVLYGICLAMVAMGIAVALPGRGVPVVISLLIFTLGGMGIMLILGIANVITNTYVQRATDRHMLGKTSAFGAAFATVCIPFGQLLFGTGIDLFAHRIPILIIIFAGATFGVTLLVRHNSHKIAQAMHHN